MLDPWFLPTIFVVSACVLTNELIQEGSESELLYDGPFTANQFVLTSSFLRLTTRDFLLQLNPYSHSPYVTSSLTSMLGFSSSVRIAHIACFSKFFLLYYTQVLSQYRLCKAELVYLTYLMLQRQLSHLNSRKLDRRQVQAYYSFYICLRLLLCCEHVYAHYFV
jgi:hypothetical protein